MNLDGINKVFQADFTFSSYCFSLASASSVLIISPMYSMTMVCFSMSLAAYKPSPWIFDLNHTKIQSHQ